MAKNIFNQYILADNIFLCIKKTTTHFAIYRLYLNSHITLEEKTLFVVNITHMDLQHIQAYISTLICIYIYNMYLSLSLYHTHTHTHTHMLVFMVYGDFP